jgi:DNA-binding transcriptional LysR family regulator
MTELNRLDWNLVAALHALLLERNVSQAALRLGVSQPAASRALGRLRRHFGDDLLVREGGGYVLTPVARRLRPMVAEAVAATEAILGTAQTFDPATSDHEFTIGSSEYGQVVFGSRLLEEVRRTAPNVRITFRWPGAQEPHAGALVGVDGCLGPRDLFTDVPATGLHRDRWVCVVSADHPDVGEILTVDNVSRLSWVLPTVPQERERPWVQRMLAHGVQPHIAATTESFASVPHLVIGTRHVGVVQEGLVRRVADRSELRILECPWPMVPLTLTFWWHANKKHDPAHSWLRAAVATCMSEQPGPG